MAVPKQHSQEDDRNWDVHSYEKLVEASPEWSERVNTKKDDGHQGRDTCKY